MRRRSRRCGKVVRQFQDTNHTPGVLVGIWSPKGTFVSATGVADLTTGTPLTHRHAVQDRQPDQGLHGATSSSSSSERARCRSTTTSPSGWPGVPNGDQITIRELLNMTSGLSTGFLIEEANVEKLATGCTEEDVLAAGASHAPGRAARHQVVLQQLRLRPAGAGRGADHGPGHQHGHPAAHRQTPRAAPHPPSHLGKRPERAVHPRVRDRRRHVRPGAGCCLGRRHRPAAVVRRGVGGHGLHALGSARLVSGLGDRCPAQAGGLEGGQKDPIPYAFSDNYNGPGRWLQGLGFVESGGFIGKEGSFPGYESITMYSPSRHTTIEVVSTKQPNAITPTRMFQALAMASTAPTSASGSRPPKPSLPATPVWPNQNRGNDSTLCSGAPCWRRAT